MTEGRHHRGVGVVPNGTLPYGTRELPYGTYWLRGEEALRIREILEATGQENVRTLIGSRNPADYIMIRGELFSVGFAHEWLAWHDRQKDEREAEFRNKKIFWARWGPATALIGAVVGAVVGAIVTWLLK
jgi:hypothetical protein